MLILNTGGTFNKRYNPFTGELEVPVDNIAVDKIAKSIYEKLNMAGVIYKDSLDIDIDDRKMLANIIMQSHEETFIIIHGTDTMNNTAEFLNEIFEDRKIILVGAMRPFEIEPIESSLNFGMALGFANSVQNNGVYICMSGFIELWDKLVKDKNLGTFKLVE